MAHDAHLPAWLLGAEERGAPSMLAEHRANSDAAGKRALHLQPGSGVATVGSTCTPGTVSLRNCLELLVKVQKTQVESVDVLTSLRERLFPIAISKPSDDDRPLRSVVTHDEVDQEVVRLRILEVKHSDFNLKLSESIVNLMHPFQSLLRPEVAKTTGAGDAMEKSGSLWDTFARVSFLHEQFMGLAQLEEEAMQSLGTQLSQLFTPTSGSAASHCYHHHHHHHYYYYYPFSVRDEVDTTLGEHSNSPQIVVLRFLLQLEDVMASKQHFLVCLAMALRSIYDPAAAGLTGACTLMGRSDFNSRVERRNNSDAPVSISVSPVTITHPSRSAAREESLPSVTRPLPPGQVREFQHDSESTLECTRTESTSPSPKACSCGTTETANNVVVVVVRGEESGGAKEHLQSSYDRDVSPASGIPRSPSFCTYGVDAVDAALEASSPPPPLARCLQREAQEREEREEEEEEERQERERQPNDKWKTRHDGDVEKKKEEEDEANGVVGGICLEGERQSGQREGCGLDLAAENLRLCRMLEAKDKMILTMQEHIMHNALLPQHPGGSAGRSRSCSCSTRPPCCGGSGEEGLPSRSSSASSGGEQMLRESLSAPPPPPLLSTPSSEPSAASSELQRLRDQIAAHVEENQRLHAGLSAQKEEAQNWKRAAQEMKEDNKMWRKRERVARVRCEQLENDVVLLKKRLLTVEGALMLQRAVSSTQAASRGVDGSAAACPVEGTPSSTRSRSRTQPPSMPDEVAAAHTSASLRQKRGELLAKLGRRLEEDPQPPLPTESPAAVLDEELVEVVSPLTEERVLRGGGAAAVLSRSPPAERIDRRLSPEYRGVAQGERPLSFNNNNNNNNNNNSSSSYCRNNGSESGSHNGSTDGGGSARLCAQDVSRILASARSLLRTIGATRRDHTHLSSAGVNSSHLVWSDRSSSSHEDNSHDARAAPMEEVLPQLRRSSSPPNGALSPCSSVSYSSAKKRAQRFHHPDGSGAALKARTVAADASVSSPPALPLSSLLSPHTGAGDVVLAAPPSRGDASHHTRRSTAREALMRELRNQLHVLQTQHAGVLHQEEQLRLKRKQVMATVQRSGGNGVGGGGSGDTGRNRLDSLLQRFDTTQAKLRENEARLCDYVNIVKRQLQTLEDDLL